MRNQIPNPIISLLSNYLPQFQTHAELDSLFLYGDAPGDPPEGNKQVKVQNWLRRINKESKDPTKILGKLIEQYMELPDEKMIPSFDTYAKNTLKEKHDFRDCLINTLASYGLTYISGGIITTGGSLPSISLEYHIQKKNIPAIDLEFKRSLDNVDSNPLEAISAACNILESICKVFIEEEHLALPTKQDLRSLWKVVAESLNFNPNVIQDVDLKKIISGMYSIVDGISSLRTHGSSAHGQGKKMYKPKPRHARFTVNAAHSLALFILETWSENNSNS